jgi:LPXTG-site transpeptidase (sortase) family protein
MASFKSIMAMVNQKLLVTSSFRLKRYAVRIGVLFLVALFSAFTVFTVVRAAAVITATKTYTLFTDADANGLASPGDILEYTVTISNSGTDANGVVFSDTIDDNTTFVPDSLIYTPLAATDTYPETVVGNVGVDSSKIDYSVITNDNLGLPAVTEILAFDATSSNGGTIVMTTSGPDMGQFTYNPPPGFEGIDTFTYTLTNSVGSVVGTVNIPVSGMIWFINNNAASCTTLAAGCGRLSNPFSTLAAFNALNGGVGNNPAVHDNIFIYESASNYGGATTVLNGQKLIGQDSGTSLATITGLTTGVSSAALPVTNAANGIFSTLTNTVTLGMNSTVQGMKVNTANNSGITGTSVTGVSVSEVSVTTTTGTAVSLLHTGGTFSFGSISTNGASKGISLNDTNGSFTVNGTNSPGSGGTIQNSISDGVYLNSAKNVSLSYINISNNQGSGVRAESSSGVSLQNLNVTNNSNSASNCTEVAQATCEAGIYFLNMLGTGNVISNTTVTGSYEDNIHVQNFNSNVLGNLSITNSVITNNNVSTGNVGIHVLASGSSNITAIITNNTLSGNRTDSINADAADSSHLNVTINDNTIVAGTGGNNQGNLGIDVTAASSGQVTFLVNNNSIGTNDNFITNKPLANTGINIFDGTTTSSNMSGVVTNNKVQNDNISNGGLNSGSGIRVFNSNLASMQVNVKGNKVRGVSLDYGILAESSGTTLAPDSGRGLASFGVTNNDVIVGSMALDDIRVQARNYNSVCARITGNDTAFGGTDFFGIFTRQANTAVFNLESGSENLAANNPLAGSIGTIGTITTVGANSCGSIPVAMMENSTRIAQVQSGPTPGEKAQILDGESDSVEVLSSADKRAPVIKPSTPIYSMIAFRSSDSKAPAIVSDYARNPVNIENDILSGKSSSDIAPVNLGILSGGSSVIIKYKVMINDPLVPLNTMMVSNQGTVSGSDFVSIMTDDPGVVGSSDPTVTLLPKPELTAIMTNTVSGTTLLSAGWTWSIQVDNAGLDAARFADGDIIFTDDLPDTGLSYGAVSVTMTSGLSGTMNCGIASNTLTCSASGDVQFAVGGQFAITFDVTPIIAGIYSNPRSGGTCAIDPNDKVVESDDTNNTCSDSVIVNTPPAITSAESATFPVNVSGSFTITTSPGYPVATTISYSGTVPTGITFTDNGDGAATLTGTPTVTGDYPLDLTASNGILPNAGQDFLLIVSEAASFISAAETTFVVDNPESFTISTTGFPLPAISYTSSPDLPTSRITLVDNGNGTATLSGTPDASDVGVYTINLTGDNSILPDASQVLTLTIGQPPVISSPDHVVFEVGSTGLFNMTSTGLPSPTLSLTGTLPSGVSFSPDTDGTATLSGMPDDGEGGVYPLAIKAANGISPDYDQPFTLTVNEAPTFTSVTTTSFTTGTTGSFIITSDGYPAAAITYISSPDLPAGVGLADNGDGTATLSWTSGVTDGGIYTIHLTGTNGIGSNATQTLTLTIGQPPHITNSASHTMEVGVADTFTYTTTGYPIPALTLTGSLPSGVTFSDSGDGTATLSGTPTQGQGNVYPLNIKAGNGVLPDDSQSFTLNVNELPEFTSGASVSFVTGASGSFTITTRGYPSPSITYSSDPVLPASLTLVDNGNGTATLSGTPLDGEGGVYTISLTGDNSIGEDAIQTLTVTIGQVPIITSIGNVTFVEGKAGLFVITTTGLPDPDIIFSGSLPTSITLVDQGDGTALLEGTPQAGAAGNYPITLTAANGIGTSDTQDFTLTVDISAGVSRITSQVDTGDGQLVENERTRVQITQLGVVFNKEVNSGDAGNVNNYLLTDHSGSPVSLDTVVYNNGTLTSSLSVNGGTALPEGLYALTIKGTIRDAFGYQIGTDFQRIFYIDTTGIRQINNGISLPSGTIVVEGATLNEQVSSLIVTFNEDAANPPGDNGMDDITNPANYLLVRSGLNGLFDTTSCVNGVGGDDIAVPTGPVTYSNNGGSGPFFVEVGVNGGTRLENGLYKIFVCGTTSITDLAGNPLNDGSDQTLSFIVFMKSSVRTNPATGFAPGRNTLLPDQPREKAYQSLGKLWIEVPFLGLRSTITGVPLETNGWDLTWLNKQVGWLEGTAAPTWSGNTVLTAHAYTADGLPGPFAFLKNLKYGDTVIIHLGGQKYTYKVQEKTYVTANNTTWLTRHEDYSWVTLITCNQYDEKTKKYVYRTVVRAVLVKVEAE